LRDASSEYALTKRSFFFPAFLTAVSAVLCLASLSCSGPSVPKLPVQVEFTSPTSSPSIDQGQSVNFTVKLANNPTGEGVTWSLQASEIKPVGELINTTPSSATYNAPTLVTKQIQVTVVATSVADMTSSAAIAVILNPSPQVTSSSPITGPCPAAGSVITFGAQPFAFGWTVGANSTFDLRASGGVPPYNWAVTSGTLPAGLSIGVDLVTNNPAILGTPTSSICSSITIQATDAAGASASAPFYILVLPPPLTVKVPPIAATYAQVPYLSMALVATGGVPPYTWSADPKAALPPGLALSAPAHNPNIAVISGTPPTAVNCVNAGNCVTPDVFVNDSQLPYPASAKPNVNFPLQTTVLTEDFSCHTGLEATLNSTSGPYAFLLRGFDASGPVVIAGNFTVDGNGHVTGGIEDINRSSGPQISLAIQPDSSYTLGGLGGVNGSSLDRGCLTLINSAGTTLTFRTAFGACSTSPNTNQGGGCTNNGYFTRGRILLDDPSTGIRATGIIRLQDATVFTSSGLSGLYAFGFSGWDAAGGRYAVAGSANASSGSFSSVAADINDAGTLGSNLTGGSGSFSVAANGRGTANIAVGSASYDLAVYPVSGSEAIFATTDSLDAVHPMLSGEALSAAGSFTAAMLQNTYMLRMAGLSSGAPDPNIGLLTFDGVATVTGSVFENNGGTLGTTAISAGYSVDGGTGRLTLSAPQQNQNLGAHPIVAYMTTPASGISAFLVSTDSSAQAGILQFQIQNPPPNAFSSASLQGPFYVGTDEDLSANTTNFVGAGVADGVGGLGAKNGFFLDVSSVPGQFSAPLGLVPNVQFTSSYSIGKTGTGTFGGQTISVSNGTAIFSLDESPLDLSPSITVVEQ
jgi:hypothetical protein